MSDKTEALYLADVIENDPTSSAHHYAAVAWMRSQYAEIQRLSDVVSKVNSRCDHLGIRLGEVTAERDALLADAERYRWLRSTRDEDFWLCHEKDGYGGQILMYGVDLDAAIDAAKGGGNG